MGQQKPAQRIVNIHQGFGTMPTFLFGGATPHPESVIALGPSRIKLNPKMVSGTAGSHSELDDIFKRIWKQDE